MQEEWYPWFDFERETVRDRVIAQLQRGFVFLLLLVFPLEPSHFRWHIHAFQPLVHIKLGFFLSDLIILVVFFLFFLRSKKEWVSAFWTGPSKWLYCFFAVGVISVIFSDLPYTHEHSLRLCMLVTKILLFSSLFFLLQEGGKAFLHQIFYVVGTFAVIEAVLAIYCYYTQSFLDLKSLRQIPFSEMPNSCHFDLAHGFRWIGDRWLGIERTPSLLRSYGTFNHPNILGGYFIFTLLISYFLFFQDKKRWLQIAVACSIFLQVMGLSVTFSRAALFSWVGATLLFFLLFPLLAKEKFLFLRKQAYWLMGVVALSLLLSFVFFEEQFLHRGVIQYNEVARNSDLYRLKAMNTAFFMIQQHPFLGVGMENFVKSSTLMLGREDVPMIHNCYLLIAAEMGTIALLVFLCFLASLFYGVQKKLLSLEVLLLFSYMAGILVIALFDFYPLCLEAGMVPFFVSLSLFTAFLRIQKKNFLESEVKDYRSDAEVFRLKAQKEI